MAATEDREVVQIEFEQAQMISVAVVKFRFGMIYCDFHFYTMHMCCEFRPGNRCFARHLLVEIMPVCVNMCVHIQMNMHSVWSKFYQILYATLATALTLTFSSYKIMVKDYFEMLLKKEILTSKQLAQQVFIGQNTLQSTF